MSIIICTDDGIEIDGVLLKDNMDLKAYISAHLPEQLEIKVGVVKPYPLEISLLPGRIYDLQALINIVVAPEINVTFKLNQPFELEVGLGLTSPEVLYTYIILNQPSRFKVLFGLNQPEHFSVVIGRAPPYDISIYLHGWAERDLMVVATTHKPVDLCSYLIVGYPISFYTQLSGHGPKDLYAYLLPVPYKVFNVYLQPFHWLDFSAIINNHVPSNLAAYISLSSPEPLLAYINPMYAHSFKVWFFTVKQSQIDLTVYLKATKAGILSLELSMHIWSLKDLYVYVSGHEFQNLNISTWVWTPSDVQVAIDTHFPSPIFVGFSPQPEDGVDLRIVHGFYELTKFSVVLTAWEYFYNLRAQIWGVYTSNLNVELRMGGSKKLDVLIPMTTGYHNLYVTCKPASRIMTTIIPVYTIEIKDLYVSINQGWPCGFGSSYKLLSVFFDTAYFHAFTATFKVIDGSGADIVGVFINRAYFDTYINKFDIHIRIPEEVGELETYIHDRTNLVYDNEFSDLYQDIIQVTFDWPRVRLLYGLFSFSVELFAYRGDKDYGLTVILYAQKQAPVRQPTSVPKRPRGKFSDPVWPDVFQVQEIELWGDDPPELVRIIEIKFEEQIHEYYWVSSEQKAMAKKVYERWAFLTRGYLPSVEYSGQIDYLTMRSLSSMYRYDTIDQAIRAMISNFLYSSKLKFEVSCLPHGGYSNLLIDMTIRDYNHLRNLNVFIEPMHVQPLIVDLTPL